MRIENILWDFDGVLIDSMDVRDKGFEIVLSNYRKDDVLKLITYHRLNGGLSRYHKFRYFFESILGRGISEDNVRVLAKEFSEIMIKNLSNPNLLISHTIDFIKKNKSSYNMHVVSGSDEVELRNLCEVLDISQYFLSIHGSPTTKTDLVRNLLRIHNYRLENTVVIGDSINDFEAARINGVEFIGYGNERIRSLSTMKSFLNV